MFALCRIGIVFVAGLTLAGCQAQMLSDDRMASSIAGTLGVAVGDVTLSNRRSDGPTNTYVVATVRNGGSYACVINGGGLLAAGVINPPTCNPIRQ